MGETLTPQQLRNNSYHLAIRSSLLAIQSTLFLQETMLQSQHATFTDIKATIASQNSTLQNTTKALVELFSKISSFQPPPAPPTPLSTAAVGSKTLAPTSPKSSTPPSSSTAATAVFSRLISPQNHLPLPQPKEFQPQNHQPQSQQRLIPAPNADAETISQPPYSDSPMLPSLKLPIDRPAATLKSSSTAALPPPPGRASPEQQKPVFGAGLNQPPPLFWGSTASQPPFSWAIGLHAYFAEAKAHNVVFGKMNESNWALSVTMKNDDKIKSKEFCGEDYICFLRGLFACEIMMVESKVLIFDPGGTFAIEFTFEAWSVHYDVQAALNMLSQQAQILVQARNLADLHILKTLRTRSIFMRGVMIRTQVLLVHVQQGIF